jgi:hypothetical protein
VTFVPDRSKDDDRPLKKPRSASVLPGDPIAPNGEIGVRLKTLYAEFEREPIPTRLLDLLEQLSQAERKAEE